MRKLRHRRSERETVTAMANETCICACLCSDFVCSCQPIPTHAIAGLQSSSGKTLEGIRENGKETCAGTNLY